MIPYVLFEEEYRGDEDDESEIVNSKYFRIAYVTFVVVLLITWGIANFIIEYLGFQYEIPQH